MTTFAIAAWSAFQQVQNNTSTILQYGDLYDPNNWFNTGINAFQITQPGYYELSFLITGVIPPNPQPGLLAMNFSLNGNDVPGAVIPLAQRAQSMSYTLASSLPFFLRPTDALGSSMLQTSGQIGAAGYRSMTLKFLGN